MQNKYFKYLLIIVLITFVVPQVTLAAWWNPFTWNWNIFSWFTPHQVQKQENNNSDETANWKTYTSNQYRFEIKYPQDWKATDTSLGGHPSLSVGTFSFGYIKDAYLGPVSIVVWPNPYNRTIVQELRIKAGGIGNCQTCGKDSHLATLSDCIENNSQIIKVSGENGLRCAEISFNGHIQIVISHGGYIYFFENTAVSPRENQNQEDDIFDQMLSTFKFIKKLENVDSGIYPKFTLCTSDSDCPSLEYICQKGLGYTGKVISSNSYQETLMPDKGLCGLKEGSQCMKPTPGIHLQDIEKYHQCIEGLVCYNNACMKPSLSQQCSGPKDTSCPNDYKCTQGCGPPVVRSNEPPPSYFCVLKDIPRSCPICLAENTEISTPAGNVNVKYIKVGDIVWSLDKNGKKIKSSVIKISSTVVPENHKVVHMVLSDKREVWVSENHPIINNFTVDDLMVGDFYDGATVKSTEVIPYWSDKTYDILPDNDTGYYWANGILLGSTLK